ncbi:MAG: putative transcriptional regulator [Nocardioides sp.]|nr:putative transcriptional regulator [Nocardioides sp.]
MGFAAGRGQVPGCEVMSVAELRDRAPAEEFRRPQRLALHFLLVVHEGAGRHVVDFEEVGLAPGAVLWARAGQVHQWGDMTAYDGTVVIFEAAFLDVLPEWDDLLVRPRVPVLEGAAAEPLVRRVRDLVQVAGDPRPTAAVRRAAILRLLLAATLLDFASRAEPGDRVRSRVFDELVDDVERHYRTERDVTAYAARLGYSTRTLARATRAATGQSPKELVDARVMLEARRLLAHGELGIGRIAEHLGFAEASNFTKFFRQRAGALPSEVRRSFRAG